MKYRKSLPQKLIDSWPGRKTFGVYRFLPLFFGLGACLEFCMINWTVGQTNFYQTFKTRKAKEIVDERLAAQRVQGNPQ